MGGARGRACPLDDQPLRPCDHGVDESAYNDAINVSPSAHSAVIRCSAQSVGDLHCAAAPLRDQYATGATFNAIELWGRDALQTECSSLTALYKVTVPVQP